MFQIWSYLEQRNYGNRYYSLKEYEKVSKSQSDQMLGYRDIALRSFSDVLTSTFIAAFGKQYLQVQVGSKTFLQ